MRMDPGEFGRYEKIFPTKPFERKGSKQFIEAVKEGNITLAKWMLLKVSKFFSHDFDKMW